MLRAGEEISFAVEVEEDSADELVDLVDQEEDGLDEAFVLPHLHSWLEDDGDAVAQKGLVAYAEVLLHGWSPHDVLNVRGGHEEDDCACQLGSHLFVGGLV